MVVCCADRYWGNTMRRFFQTGFAVAVMVSVLLLTGPEPTFAQLSPPRAQVESQVRASIRRVAARTGIVVDAA